MFSIISINTTTLKGSYTKRTEVDNVGLSLLIELDENGRHVVHSVLRAAAVLADQLIKQILQYLSHSLLLLKFAPDVGHHIAVRLHFPDAVAAHYYELQVLVLELGDVGIGSDHLLLGG